jgi:isopenicillin-N epimerase
VAHEEGDLARHWTLDPAVHFLNHGSFGATPRVVLEAQSELRARMERQPVRFFMRDLPKLLDASRAALGGLLGADPDDIAFVPNATSGVNTVLRSLALTRDDEVVTTSHEYNACKNALEVSAERAGARVVVADVPYPIEGPEQAVQAVLAAVTPRTRLVLIDHVTSQTALVLPVARIVAELAARGIDTLIDGAHAPGMVPLDLRAIGAAYYTGNCHKWVCAPKGAAFLYVRRDRQAAIRPLQISHGHNSPRRDQSRFRIEFDWTGTTDPTPHLCILHSIEFLSSLFPGGFPEVMERNHQKALAARARLASALGATLPCPDEMIGSIATIPLPDSASGGPTSVFNLDPLQDALLDQYSIEVPIIPWPAPPRRLLRISAQLYNTEENYEHLARALTALLPASP